MISQVFPELQGVFNAVMAVGSLAGVWVLEYSVVEGVWMIWDKIVHGKPFFD